MKGMECIIVGCPTSLKSAGPPVASFVCPQESRQEWLEAIPKKLDPMPEKLVVCERHFQPDLIQRTRSCPDEQGNVVTFKLGTPRLKLGAVPTIFPHFLDPPPPADEARPRVPYGGSKSTKAFSNFDQLPLRENTTGPSINSSAPQLKANFAIVDHVVRSAGSGQILQVQKQINRRMYCETCGTFLDGPCYEHVSPVDFVYDKPPIPLAYASLPDMLSISTNDANDDGLPTSASEEFIIARESLRAGMLFGPLIAPLVPLGEVEDPPRYVLWSEDTEEFQAYDLRDNFVCNWTKFLRPTSDFAQVNVVAYQQKDHIYFFTLKEIPPDTELRVFVKVASNCKVLDDWVSPLLDHLLASRDQSETSFDEPMPEDAVNLSDFDGRYPSSPEIPSPSACSSKKRKPTSTSEPATPRRKYARRAKMQPTSHEGDSSENDERGHTSDEYEQLEDEDGMSETEGDVSEGDFERLEEFEDEDMKPEEKELHAKKRRQQAERKNAGSGKKGMEKHEECAEKDKKPPTKRKSSAQPLTMEDELARLEQARAHKRKGWKVQSAKYSSDAVKYKNNELTGKEKAAFEKRRDRRKVYKKEAYRERTEINRRYANGEISLEEKQALEQERIRRGKERAHVGKYGQEAWLNLEKAVDAVMNQGMSEAEARKLYQVRGDDTLRFRLIKAGYLPQAGYLPRLPRTEVAKPKTATVSAMDDNPTVWQKVGMD